MATLTFRKFKVTLNALDEISFNKSYIPELHSDHNYGLETLPDS